MIHQTNQQKSENELQLLNNMVNKAREVRQAFWCHFSFLTACKLCVFKLISLFLHRSSCLCQMW